MTLIKLLTGIVSIAVIAILFTVACIIFEAICDKISKGIIKGYKIKITKEEKRR